MESSFRRSVDSIEPQAFANEPLQSLKRVAISLLFCYKFANRAALRKGFFEGFAFRRKSSSSHEKEFFESVLRLLESFKSPRRTRVKSQNVPNLIFITKIWNKILRQIDLAAQVCQVQLELSSGAFSEKLSTFSSKTSNSPRVRMFKQIRNPTAGSPVTNLRLLERSTNRNQKCSKKDLKRICPFLKSFKLKKLLKFTCNPLQLIPVGHQASK